MFDHLKRLFKHSVIYGLSETISRGTGFILLLIYLRILDADDIGTRSLVYAAAGFVTLFYTLGLDNAFLRYFMDKKYSEEKSTIFSTALLFTFFMGFLFFTGTWIFDVTVSSWITKNSTHTYIVHLIFAVLVFDTVVIYPTLVLRAENRMNYFTLVSMLRFVLMIGLNIIVVWYLQRGLKGIFETNLIVVILVAGVLIPIFRNYLRFNFSFRIFKILFQFGVPTIFTLFFMRIIDFSDRYLIAYFFGAEGTTAVGYYTPSYTLGMVGIMVFVNSFRLAWQPFFLSVKDNPDARQLFSKVATYYSIFIGMVFLGMTLFREEIFREYTAGKFPVSLSGIIPFVALAYLLYGFYFIMLAGIFIREKTKYLPIAPISGALLNLGLNFIFIPKFGIIGASYTTVIAYATMVIILFIISRKIYTVSYEYYRIGVVFFVTSLMIAVSLFVRIDSAIPHYLFTVLLLLVPPVIYWFCGFLKAEEMARIKKFS
ncbi:MAG: oligosaccharide flippase family protein [Candidatus Latescibacteria bacterium]|nr:oligosaccharide flippase family protein [Candidatus Latescibacterota bacterium]